MFCPVRQLRGRWTSTSALSGADSRTRAFHEDLQLDGWFAALVFDPVFVNLFVTEFAGMVQNDKWANVGNSNGTGSGYCFDYDLCSRSVTRERHKWTG